VLKQLGKAVRIRLYKIAVGGLHGIQGIGCREGLASEVLSLKSLDHRWLNAKAVPLDMGPFVSLSLTLLNASKIEGTLESQVVQLRQVFTL
jgi:hypothetical protein